MACPKRQWTAFGPYRIKHGKYTYLAAVVSTWSSWHPIQANAELFTVVICYLWPVDQLHAKCQSICHVITDTQHDKPSARAWISCINACPGLLKGAAKVMTKQWPGIYRCHHLSRSFPCVFVPLTFRCATFHFTLYKSLNNARYPFVVKTLLQ